MEEDQELKHVCKSCCKSFPCGRSLGGHMRSHITNNSAESEEKLATRKLSSSVINGGSKINEAGTNTGYGLRENRKKTWRASDLSEGTSLLDKFCQECGKGFHSWKALFGHMKCHSQKERVCNSLEDQDSWTDATQKQVLDSQSDNEAGAPNRRRRSKRRTRYTASATTSSLSFANPSSSVSEVEQEQEEVAISLMMLSRDLGSWGGSVAENSDNSGNFEARSSVRTNLVSKIEGKKMPISNGSEKAKLTNRSDQKWEISNVDSSKGKKSELLSSEFPRNGFRINGFIENDKAKKPELDFQSVLEDSEDEQGKNEVNGTEIASIKRKFVGSELKSNFSKNLGNKLPEAEFSKNFHKRGKFECTTCNKIFSSYQALGGHRASHKKTKGCFASRNESSENSIETDLSPDATTESKIIKNSEYEHELSYGFDHEADIVAESKKSKGHTCPICLKIFSSGQALGGHKRSHLGGGSASRKDQTVQEIRDFLDLNLPAATEEESHGHSESYRPWWVRGSSHKQEALVGLVSN